jgi:hypothetical protein
MLDAASGTPVRRVLQGVADGVELGPLLRALEPGREYISVHSHPDSTSFSPSDVALILRFPAVCLIAVVGADGTWYVLSREPDRPSTSREVLVATYQVERDAARIEYERLVQDGVLTRRNARRALSHDIWVAAAPKLGLRYDRIEGGL